MLNSLKVIYLFIVLASSIPPTNVIVKRQSTAPPSKTSLQTTRNTGQRMVAKKPNTGMCISVLIWYHESSYIYIYIFTGNLIMNR